MSPSGPPYSAPRRAARSGSVSRIFRLHHPCAGFQRRAVRQLDRRDRLVLQHLLSAFADAFVQIRRHRVTARGMPDRGLHDVGETHGAEATRRSPSPKGSNTLRTVEGSRHRDRPRPARALVGRERTGHHRRRARYAASTSRARRCGSPGSSPDSYDLKVRTDGKPFWLVLGRPAATVGRRGGGESLGTPQLVNGFANGWLVRPGPGHDRDLAVLCAPALRVVRHRSVDRGHRACIALVVITMRRRLAAHRLRCRRARPRVAVPLPRAEPSGTGALPCSRSGPRWAPRSSRVGGSASSSASQPSSPRASPEAGSCSPRVRPSPTRSASCSTRPSSAGSRVGLLGADVVANAAMREECAPSGSSWRTFDDVVGERHDLAEHARAPHHLGGDLHHVRDLQRVLRGLADGEQAVVRHQHRGAVADPLRHLVGELLRAGELVVRRRARRRRRTPRPLRSRTGSAGA